MWLPQVIFDNILNRNIPWPGVPEDMSYEAQDLINRYETRLIRFSYMTGTFFTASEDVAQNWQGVEWFIDLRKCVAVACVASALEESQLVGSFCCILASLTLCCWLFWILS